MIRDPSLAELTTTVLSSDEPRNSSQEESVTCRSSHYADPSLGLRATNRPVEVSIWVPLAGN